MQHTNILQQSLTMMQENIIQDLQQFVSKATTKFMTKLDDTLSNVYNNVKHMVYQTLTTANKNLRSASQVILESFQQKFAASQTTGAQLPKKSTLFPKADLDVYKPRVSKPNPYELPSATHNRAPSQQWNKSTIPT